MNQKIKNKTLDSERSLYNLKNAEVLGCVFAGPADGESALKETRNVTVKDCTFSLRYPLWHAENFTLCSSKMDELTRAAIWYAKGGLIDSCHISGIKFLRECSDIRIENSRVISPEFGWKCRNITIDNSEVQSEYLLFESSNIKAERLKMNGKYSFQYINNMTLDNCELDTKDAFWHTSGVTVKNSIVKGEYLGWYSDGLTLINCRISGTQPLCYCKNLKLIDCTMEGTDLAFEYSDVSAVIIGKIDSIKNPRSGSITAEAIGEIINDSTLIEPDCEITLGSAHTVKFNISSKRVSQ